MEAGNHEDIRWATMGGDNLPILMAVSDGKLL
jgi:beta-galactosidase